MEIATKQDNLTSKSDKLLYAYTLVDQLRKLDSSNTVYRDAEYYLFSYGSAYTGDALNIVNSTVAPIYSALKAAQQPFGLDLMRTAPNLPSSNPGGVSFAYRGLIDGLRARAADGFSAP